MGVSHNLLATRDETETMVRTSSNSHQTAIPLLHASTSSSTSVHTLQRRLSHPSSPLDANPMFLRNQDQADLSPLRLSPPPFHVAAGKRRGRGRVLDRSVEDEVPLRVETYELADEGSVVGRCDSVGALEG